MVQLTENLIFVTNFVTIYENPNFSGRSRTLGVGGYRFFTPEDFNDVVSSISVPAGFGAMLFEHADDGGGYGISVDLLEDCADLSKYDLMTRLPTSLCFRSPTIPALFTCETVSKTGISCPAIGNFNEQAAPHRPILLPSFLPLCRHIRTL
jgi:hypothetical protein